MVGEIRIVRSRCGLLFAGVVDVLDEYGVKLSPAIELKQKGVCYVQGWASLHGNDAISSLFIHQPTLISTVSGDRLHQDFQEKLKESPK